MARKKTDYSQVTKVATRKEEPKKSTVRTKPVRTTIDLDPALYDEITAWVRQASVDTRRTVTQAEVTRALYQRLVTNQGLERAIRRSLKEQNS